MQALIQNTLLKRNGMFGTKGILFCFTFCNIRSGFTAVTEDMNWMYLEKWEEYIYIYITEAAYKLRYESLASAKLSRELCLI